jgi:NAD(P)-dependent dehydrogenase (short-subunit alcohol dehydrogenase family)
MAKSLSGKVVAITGGARGIGRATAEALVAKGARVAIGDIDEALVAATASEIGADTIGLKLDVTDVDSFESFLLATEDLLGPLDVLINNAGIMPLGDFVDEQDSTADRMIAINLNGVIFGSRLALRRFIPRGSGHLVNVASTAGKFGAPGGATYSATKHAVVGLSEAIRREVMDKGIDVTIVMPLAVNTELGSGLLDTRGLKVLQPEDVAKKIVRALETGKVDVYVPSWIGSVLRSQGVVPRRFADFLNRVLGGDQVLTHTDPALRAAYQAKVTGAPVASSVPVETVAEDREQPASPVA